MSIEQGIGAARQLENGLTGIEQAKQFVNIRMTGIADLVKRFRELASAASQPEVLRKCVRRASEPIFEGYKQRAKEHEATGNLAAATTRKYKDYPEGAVAVIGPRQTGPVGDRPGRRSANHAWLVEFGTDARRPGTRGRRKYINVHQMINGKMSRAGSLNDEQFRAAGAGYYYLMGSINEPTRQGGGRPGYPRDFAGPGPGGDGRKQHPITLKPGETIAGMPAQNLMQDTIAANTQRTFNLLKAALEAEITARGG